LDEDFNVILTLRQALETKAPLRRSPRTSVIDDVGTYDVPAELEAIPVLSNFGLYLFRAPNGGVCICLNDCKRGIRPGDIRGHLKTHFKYRNLPSKTLIDDALEGLQLIRDDEAVELPQRIVAPFPFLKLYPDDVETDKDAQGWHCSYCHFCTLSRQHALNHVREKHPEPSATKSISHHLKQGHMQRFFHQCHGSSYFRVDPLLCGVKEGSDFDMLFSSIQRKEDAKNISKPVSSASAAVDEADWDMSPFLAKAGWLTQIRGYSTKLMRERVSLLRKDEASFFRILPSLAIDYLKSVTQAEINSSVSPIALQKLNNWKS
jgi:hypothetical protein